MNIDDKRLGLLVLLTKLDVVGVRRIKYSLSSIMANINPPPIPPMSIQCALVSTYLEYLQFVPKHNYPGEDWIKI